MSDRKASVFQQCEAAISRIDSAIINHEQNKPEDLSVPLLRKVRVELLQMKDALSPSIFLPSYARFILDWPAEHGLVKQLSDVAYQYGRLK
jgi:hypothetical protein